MYTEEKLKELQALSLEDKIALSKLRITEFYEHYNGNVVVTYRLQFVCLIGGRANWGAVF